MRKTVPVLALIAFACDFFSHGVLVHGDPAGKPEVAGRSGDYEHHQKDSRGRLDDAEVARRALEDRERGSSEPVGKWRSNGEALEPKWRDGDSVPLLPFSQYRTYSRDDVVDDTEDSAEVAQVSLRRPSKYRYAVSQNNRARGRRFPLPDEPTYRDGDPEEDYPRKRRRPLKTPEDPVLLYEKTMEAGTDGKRGHGVAGNSSKDDDKEATSARYREAFQARPNEYGHEFNDEEYLRPRPRKRRPPQNYEFALANEASSGVDEDIASSTRLPSSRNTEDQLITQPSDNARRPENALELKSLLKMQQEEGSSLSEILQRRNLTLSDLLKGKADVINALKSRIADESDEYIEEMSRMMSNSLMKLAATVSPPWKSTQSFTLTSEATTKSTTSSILNKVSKATVAPGSALAKSHDERPSNNTSPTEKSQATEKIIEHQVAHDSSWPKVTTPPSISITTSTSSPVVNSMEYYLNDDGNAGSTSDRGTRLENLDEDEIMEFSDFTDFKKAKSPATPTGPGTEDTLRQARGPGENHDLESTLSIEQILNPTERIELTKDCGDQDDDDDDVGIVDNKEAGQDGVQLNPMSGLFAEDYNAFLEAEYQNDAAINFGEVDGRRNTVKAGDSSKTISEKKQIATSTEKSDDRGLENHRSGATNNRRYEEVVSEIEPEARAEIFELFASGSAGKRLERLLKSRNMSVEELISLRQRGSSKVHLTEVSQLRVPKPKNLQTSGTVNVEDGEIVISLSPATDSNERFDLAKAKNKNIDISTSRTKQDIISYLQDPFFDKDIANTSMSRLLDLVERDRNKLRKETPADNEARDTDEVGELENPRRTVQIVDLLTTFGHVPFAKEVQRQLEAEDNEERVSETRSTPSRDHANIVLINEEEKRIVRSNHSANEFRTGFVEEITREDPNSIDIRTVYGDELADPSVDVSEEKKTLSKVKPSIIASGAILGVTIIVFLSIFIVCRLRQKQKYTYRNTFSRAVFQGPVLAARKLSNSSSLSTVMVNVVATSTAKRPERMETQEAAEEFDKSDIDNDSLDANDSWETIPDYAK